MLSDNYMALLSHGFEADSPQKKILAAACDLIARKESIDFTITEVARQAGIQPEDVLSHYANRQEIIAYSLEAIFKPIRSKLTNNVRAAESREDLITAIEGTVDIFYAALLENKALKTIFLNFKKDDLLTLLIETACKLLAKIYAEKIYNLSQAENQDEIYNAALLITKMFFLTATELDTLNEIQIDLLLNDYKRLAVMRLDSFLVEPAEVN